MDLLATLFAAFSAEQIGAVVVNAIWPALAGAILYIAPAVKSLVGAKAAQVIGYVLEEVLRRAMALAEERMPDAAPSQRAAFAIGYARRTRPALVKGFSDDDLALRLEADVAQRKQWVREAAAPSGSGQ